MSPAETANASAGSAPPPSREVLLVGLLVALIVAALVAASAAAFYTLDGVRAYVGGEGLYSKNQKDAVYHLVRYALTHDLAEYESFEAMIAVPLADARARRSLSDAASDPEIGARELVGGGNHPDDVMRMARLFRYAQWVPEMETAIAIWTEGDRHVDRLAALGRGLRGEIAAGGRAENVAALLAEIDRENEALSNLEARFSATLGAGERRIARQALLAIAGSGVALAVLGIGTSARLLRRLRRDEARFRAMIESGYDAITLVDAGGTIAYHSPSLGRMLGFESAIGRQVLELVHPDDRAEGGAAIARAIAGRGRPESLLVRALHSDGTLRWIEAVGGTVSGIGGSRVVIHSRDVTERQVLERRLAESQRLESLGRLAGGVAHDFNNLLTVILGSAAEAKLDVREGSEGEERLTEVIGAAEGAASLTRQLLSFARRQLVSPRLFDVGGLLRGAAPVLRRLAGPQVEFTLDPGGAAATVLADPGQIEQVVLNLVTNARDAMPGGGELRVALARLRLDGAVAPNELEPALGEVVRLTVSDTGVAMDEEAQKRAFEPFFSTKASERGIGLGLAVCHGIVKQSGGQITFESRAGAGTIFTIDLPFAEAKPETARQELGAAPRGTETVLLVEDDPWVRRVTALGLRRYGYRVIETEGAIAAEAALRAGTERFDLLLTDVEMPDGGGRRLVERVQHLQPGLAVLFVSGHTEDSALRSEVERSEFAFLAKPFTPAELARKVREVLDPREPV